MTTTDAVSAPRENGTGWDQPASPTAFAAFRALLLRDLRVLRREWVAFLVGSLMQPLLLVFVFAYVLPKVAWPWAGQLGPRRSRRCWWPAW
jgi:hypothetical protein